MLHTFTGLWCNLLCYSRIIWQTTLCLTDILNEASAQIKWKTCSHKHISCDWIVLCVLTTQWRMSMANWPIFNTIHDQIHSPWNRDAAADFEIQRHPHSYAIIGWDTSRHLFRNMQFSYRVAPFSDHFHISYAYAYNASLDTNAQIVSPGWKYNNTAFWINICLW